MPISKKRKRDNVTPSQKNCDNLIGFQAGNHCICSGASGRGKTWYVVDAILGSGVHKGCGSPWDAVIVMCDNISIHQPVYKKLANQFKGKGKVTFIEGLPADNEEEFLDMCKENHEKGMKTICVIDDLMTASRSGKTDQFVCKLFTSARHLGVDVWELNQNHTSSRTRRLQAGYLICFATPSDVKSIAHIARSIKPETAGKDVMAAYREATSSKNGHGCLVICLNQPEQFMFRNTDMRRCFDLKALPLDENGNPVIGAQYPPAAYVESEDENDS